MAILVASSGYAAVFTRSYKGANLVWPSVLYIRKIKNNVPFVVLSHTVSTFPIWLVGFPCSNSMMKRRPVPEVMAKFFWVAPICLRTNFTSSPICFGVYFIANNHVTARE
jgi:hypothetical protein